MLERLCAVVFLLHALHFTLTQGALGESEQFFIGIWPQTDAGYQETPASLNQVFGLNFPIFQFSQPIPVPAYDFVTGVGGPIPAAYIEATGTDADIFLTVYPSEGLQAVTDPDILSLAIQLRTYQASNRTVFLRWAPEMNGAWMRYGMQPTVFKTVWTRMYNIIKAEAPDTVVVWSPNTGYAYPFGQTFAASITAEDRTALDTNSNGRLDSRDDPYSPYYPGDDFVDWIGVSIYFKGPSFVNQNTAQVPGYMYDLLHGFDPYNPGPRQTVDWYDTYCASKPEKACVWSEAAAAWHALPNLVASADDTEVEIQQAWWRDSFLNQSLLQSHPRLKGYLQFEQVKNESDQGHTDLRDFRISNNSQVLSAFLSDLAPVSTNYMWAQATVSAAPNTTAFEITPSGPIVTATATVNQTSMITATYTQFYSGPFVNVSYAGTADPLAAPTGTLSSSAATGLGVAAAGSTPSLFNQNSKATRQKAGIALAMTLLGLSAGALTCLRS